MVTQKEKLLDIQIIVAELRSERDRIEQVIGLLEQDTPIKARVGRPPGSSTPTKPRPGGLTPAGRRKLSAAMKKRWAQKRSASSPAKAAALSGATLRKRGGLTAAGRRKLSEAMKKRWAEKKRKAS